MEGHYLLGHPQLDWQGEFPRHLMGPPLKEELDIRLISQAPLHLSQMVNNNSSSHLLILSLNRQETYLKTGLASMTIHNSRLILQTKSRNKVQSAVRLTKFSHYKHYLVQMLALREAATFDLFKMKKRKPLKILLTKGPVDEAEIPLAQKISLQPVY